jgi:flagellar P-ring protein precursor FlgI
MGSSSLGVFLLTNPDRFSLFGTLFAYVPNGRNLHMRRWIVIGITLLALSAFDTYAGKTLLEISRMKGQGASVVQGLGLVVGLDSTGDSGSELVMARPLAEALKKLGNPVSVDDLSSSKSVALVMVTCQIPREGAKTDDQFDVTVSVLNSAKSLEGGTLLISPMIARPGSPVYAFAQGLLMLPDSGIPTVATIPKGAQLVRDINTTPKISGSFDIIIDSSFAGWGATSTIASEIDQQYLLTARRKQPIAKALDARTIRVTVPSTEADQAASFFGDIMQTDISSALRKLPAKVICDTRSGIIVITGDVEVSAVVIRHKDMSINTAAAQLGGPDAQPTNFAAVYTPDGAETDTTRLDDLIAAFDQLDIPAIEQINILRMLRKSGKLQARLIVDGQE